MQVENMVESLPLDKLGAVGLTILMTISIVLYYSYRIIKLMKDKNE